MNALKRLILGTLLIGLASSVLLVADSSRRSAATSPVRHLAILQHSSQPALDAGVEGMLAGLAQMGFVDGKNIAIQHFNAENDLPTANAIAKQMTGGDNELVLTASTLSLQAVANANQAGKTVHVFGLVSDPFGAGVGISRDHPLQHPRHLVGYGTMQPVAEAFELARQLFPGLATVGTLWNPAESNSEAQLKLARAACTRLGIELVEATADGTTGVQQAATSLLGRGIQAVWVPGDVTVLAAIDVVVAAARQGRIPVFTSIPGNAPRGALFDLGADYVEVGRLAGELAGQVLRGTDPATIPVKNVMPQTLLINRAALSGLREQWKVPAAVLQRARLVGEPSPAAPTTAFAPSPASDAPLSKKWNLDIIEYVNVLDVEEAEKGMRAGLREAGLVEGRDYDVRVRNAQGDMPTISALIDAALSDGTDLLLTLSTPSLQAALQRARGVPIVFTFVADAIAAGAGHSNEDHLPNVTGVPTTGAFDELVDIVHQCVPSAQRFGTLFVPAEVNSVYNKDQLQRAVTRRGYELVAVAANTSAEVSDAALSLLSHNVDVITQAGSNLTTAGFSSIVGPAQRAHVPVFGFLSSDAHHGAIVVAARDYLDGGREAGRRAARIMRGESPAEIPFEPLRATKILVNPTAARAAGVTLPSALLERADTVIAP